MDKLFGIRTRTTLKCEDSGESFDEAATMYTLKCNIANDTNYLHQVGAAGAEGLGVRMWG